MDNYFKEAVKHYHPVLEEAAKTDQHRIIHIFKRMMKETNEPYYTSIEEKFESTFYNVVKKLPFGTVLAVLAGTMTTEDFGFWLMGKDKDTDFSVVGPDRYTGSDWPKQVEEAQEIFKKAVEEGVEDTTTTTTTTTYPVSHTVAREDFEKLKVELEDVKATLAEKDNKLKEASLTKITEKVSGIKVGEGDLTGTTTMKKVRDLFFGAFDSDMEVPVWEWKDAEGNVVAHPDVPKQDHKYIFRTKELSRTLYALLSNKRMYLHGHTGTGKTTLVEQVAAHLGWPFMRINFDSEITRMDLIGKTDLVTEGGVTVTKWFDGILPKAMASPTIAVFDEIDFCRPDVAYVMQSATEGNGMSLLEDSGRKVHPHPMFRMFATGNTVGQGDEFGMYQGARPQSLAFLDRFTVWQKVEYLSEDDRLKLIKDAAPILSDDIAEGLNNYVTEHLEAFTKSSVLQPISPRGMLSVAEATEFFISTGVKDTQALKDALEMVVLDRCTQEDYAVLKGIVDRVWK